MNFIDKAHRAEFIAIKDTNSFSDLVEDYVSQTVKLGSFYRYAPDDKGLLKAINERKNFPVDRKKLVQIIKKQYGDLSISESVKNNIALLKQMNTYTVCTAHQPNLLTGYAYFFYKIIHAVKLAKHLKNLAPENNFVPVFYIGSEDNDLEELGVFNFEGKKYRWQTAQQGAVGRMTTDGLGELFSELRKHLGPEGEHLEKLSAVIEEAYLSDKTIAAATRILINAFLGDMGIVVLDPDEPALKAQFSGIVEQELFEPKAHEIVSSVSNILNEQWKAQAFVRPINFFYLKDGLRERIEKQDEKWQVLNTDLLFSASELLVEIQEHPGRFSPNVILRGLFQETILPNVAFIGGGSEVAYWMQLKRLFHHYGVFFPSIILRQSVLVVDVKSDAVRQKLGFTMKEMFNDEDVLVHQKIDKVDDAHAILKSSHVDFLNLKNEFFENISDVDQQMKTSAEAAFTKMNHQWKVLDKKLRRATKRKHLDLVTQISELKKHLFPNGNLQERVLNFSELYLKYGDALFKDLLDHTKPYGDEFLVLHYE